MLKLKYDMIGKLIVHLCVQIETAGFILFLYFFEHIIVKIWS